MVLLRTLALAILVGFFQGALEIAWRFSTPAPDLLLLTVVWFGIRGRTPEALVIGFLGGLAVDGIAYYQPIGIRSLLLVLVAYLPEWAHYILLPENRVTGFLLVALGTVLHQILLLSLLQILRPMEVWGLRAMVDIGVLAVLNLFCWGLVTFFISPAKEPGGVV